MLKLNARELRKTPPKGQELETIKRNPIYLVLDRIIDTYNIGSLFRLADAAAITKLYLCGDMEYPPSAKIHKAGVGTDQWVPWEKIESISQLINKLKEEGVQIIAVEQDPRSVSYTSPLVPRLPAGKPIAVVVGNETDGVSKEVLDMADIIVELPMFGVNKSFNVWGSAAVVVYKLLEGCVNN